MKIWTVAALIGLCGQAGGTTMPDWMKEALPGDTIWPRAIGTHNCWDQYPKKAIAKRLEGTTSLEYRIGVDGIVKNVGVRKSSGSALLDKAGVACVSKWTYRPATLHDKPVEVSWRYDVKWAPPEQPQPAATGKSNGPDIIIQTDRPSVNVITTGHVSAPPPPQIVSPKTRGYPHVCNQDYPRDAIQENAEGKTTVGFFITVEGKTRDVHIVVSSGYAMLDDAAVTCAGRWEYVPATQGGAPLEVPWKAEISW